MKDFKNKVAVITGSTSGIGKLVADKMAALNAHVVIWGRNRLSVKGTVAEFRAKDYIVSGIVCDVRSREGVRSAAGRLIKKLGRVDILINNAGIVSGKEFLDISPEDLKNTFQTNTFSLFWVVQAFLPYMIERGTGHIVTIASAGGLVGINRLTDYCSSKFAAVGFDDALRSELYRIAPGVKTTLVCPYYVSTEMFKGVKSRIRILLPVLKPDYCARRIVRAVKRGRKRLIMPRLIFLSYLSRLFPLTVFDGINRFLGVHSSMDSFTGKKKDTDM